MAIAKRIGTSGRILVYHFGSKLQLERQIIARLEVRLREQLQSLQNKNTAVADANTIAESLLAMWKQFTTPEMQSWLKLTMDLNLRAMQGDTETQQFLDRENQQWIESLTTLTGDEAVARSLFHLFQGATLDFLTTGNAQRGEESIQLFLTTIGWKIRISR
ncbi:TetR/AcrR family transcriptional regulator [Synechocystis salina]|uniref:TetR/AcrR family transcriptional regulator n=1 Tax=Synechocystis salina LEGE 00031 TaxID=1828736 RepID=A0ABR9VR63_9SYNC|nr:TetR/AcrR family transcriptional regulator [Synechocystis salina]MBE9242891.1 TetR/AcrR family transcriptional regulator [Synechocystis salina LEGE 00041]MBE9253835.1 TetR/AcrR family transcriptional regulator [Synechocystis salina LEGE 00031]